MARLNHETILMPRKEGYARLRGLNPRLGAGTPVYHADGTLGFIRGIAYNPGALSTRVAVLSDGRITDVDEAQALFDEEHHRKWGNITLDSARLIVANPAKTKYHWAFIFSRSQTNLEQLLDDARATDPMATALSQGFPLLAASGEVDWAIEFSRKERITAAYIDEGEPVRRQAVSYVGGPLPPPPNSWLPNTSLSSRTNAYFNDLGEFALGVRVGIHELFDDCAIDDSHEAFAALSGARVTYEVQPTACGTNSECELRCGVLGDGRGILARPVCQNSICVDLHATAVASCVSASQGGPVAGAWHAAKSELFLAQLPSTGVRAEDWIENYDWYLANGVGIVSESIGAAGTFGPWSVISDWYARNHGMLIVRNSGNRPPGAPGPGKDEVFCPAYNSLCVGGSIVASQAVDSPRDHYWSGISRFKNPEGKELEKPDLLALGELLHVAIAGTTDTWSPVTGGGEKTANGTSFSTPLVAGIAALVKGLCGGRTVSPQEFRTIFRSFATFSKTRAEIALPSGFPPTDCPGLPGISGPPLYPAPQWGCDHYGGTGIVDAAILQASCLVGDPPPGCGAEESPCTTTRTGSLTSEGWTSLPEWLEPPPVKWSENATQPLRQPAGRFTMVESLGALGSGTRIRSSFSYLSCPSSPLAAASSLGAANNLDLVLYGLRAGAGQPEVLIASESLHDTNEGFDVTLTDDYKWLSIGVIGPQAGLQPCEDVNGSPLIAEPWALSTSWRLP